MKDNNLVAELETGTALLPQLPPHQCTFEIFLAIREVWSRFYLVDRLEMYSMVVMGGDITWDQNGSNASQLECEGSTATR